MKTQLYAELTAKARGEQRSIRQFSADCGVSASYITSIEKGKYEPSIQVMQKICDASQGRVCIDDFIERTKRKEEDEPMHEVVEYIEFIIGDNSLEKFSQSSNVDKGTLSKILNGKTKPTPATIRKIARNDSQYTDLMIMCGYIVQTEPYIVITENEQYFCKSKVQAYEVAYEYKGKIYKSKEIKDGVLVKGDEV